MFDKQKPCPKCGNLALTKYSTSCWFCNKELPPIYPDGDAVIRHNDDSSYKLMLQETEEINDYLRSVKHNKSNSEVNMSNAGNYELAKCKTCGYIGYGERFTTHDCNGLYNDGEYTKYDLVKCKHCGYIGYGLGFKLHKCNRGGE